MGFRNPLSSIAAVDTRATATAAGAQVYTRPIPGRADGAVQGVLEFDDGVTGDGPATLDSHPGTIRSDTIGGTTTLTGGVFGDGAGGHVALPNLSVDALPAGSPQLAGVPLPTGAQTGRRALVTGADVVVIPSGTQVQADGVPIVCASKAARDALAKTQGLTVVRTDLGGLPQRWDGTAWRFTLYGLVSGSTDANAFLVFPHSGDGQTPAAWLAMPTGQATDPITEVFKPVAWAQDGTNLTIRAVRTDTSAYFPGQPIKAMWAAFF